MVEPEYIDVVGGPLDGAKWERTEECRKGFTHHANNFVYVYRYRQRARNSAPKRRYILKEVLNANQFKGEGKEGGA